MQLCFKRDTGNLKDIGIRLVLNLSSDNEDDRRGENEINEAKYFPVYSIQWFREK